MRDANPSRLRPAAASTSASCWPSSSFRKRVSRLPRIGEKRALGRSRVSCATRRTLPVPIDGDWPRAATRSSTLVGPDDWPRLPRTTASNGFSRGSTPAIARPPGSTAGMSLLLWTARSISRRRSASSISFTNSRFPPTSERGASWRRSPLVLIVTIWHGRPPAASRRAATVRACHNASWLPRVPRRSSGMSEGSFARERLDLPIGAFPRAIAGVAQSEEPGQCFRIRADGVGIGHRFELFGRGEEQLLDNQARDLVDASAGLRRQRRELEVEPIEFRAPDGFEPLPQWHNGRDRVPRSEPGSKFLNVFGDDAVGPA